MSTLCFKPQGGGAKHIQNLWLLLVLDHFSLFLMVDMNCFDTLDLFSNI